MSGTIKENPAEREDGWDQAKHTRHENSLHYGFVDAAAIRRIAKDNGLDGLIDRVFATNRHNTVRLRWSEIKDDDMREQAYLLARYIRDAYLAHGRAAWVDVVWKGSIRTLRRAQKQRG